jgi:hypothetical protein
VHRAFLRRNVPFPFTQNHRTLDDHSLQGIPILPKAAQLGRDRTRGRTPKSILGDFHFLAFGFAGY